jgi:hypothetical protein
LGLYVVVLTAVGTPPVGPVPSWVKVRPLPGARGTVDGAAPLLLDDTQILGARTLEVFERRVWQLRSPSDVEDLGKHEFQWNPAYEKLILHGLWVWRDTVFRQRLSSGTELRYGRHGAR